MNVKKILNCANPYMPLWEHVPDGEPRVFEYNGEKRLYIYGSHDIQPNNYCGNDYVVWSAPIDDLTDWTYHGICYQVAENNRLCAPDVVQKGDTFYLYAAEKGNTLTTVSHSKCPYGPFVDPVPTKIGEDVGVLVDDDGKVYAYWGYAMAQCAELEEDMATIKEGTYREHFIGHTCIDFRPHDEHEIIEDGFFEAASPRKINGKYVFVYSKRTSEPDPKYGCWGGCTMFLSYHYSDHPLDGYVRGGDISINCGELITLPNGQIQQTYPEGNNHGGMVEIDGQWYISYHRHTNAKPFARQAMLDPVDVAIDKDGRVFIGRITYDENGEPIASEPVEMTSQGPHLNGIDARMIIPAAYTCHISGDRRAYVQTVHGDRSLKDVRVRNIYNGTTIGFRYLQFGEDAAKAVTLYVNAFADCTVNVRVDSYQGEIVSTLKLKAGDTEVSAPTTELSGKHAVYFEFIGDSPEILTDFYHFTFD